jgi:hypothetical protein
MRAFWFALPFALLACSDANNNPVYSSGALSVTNLHIGTNIHNVISFRVSFTATDGDSAQILYMGPGDSNQTPWVKLTSGPNLMQVLGLLPSTFYRMTLVVRGPGGLMVTPQFVGSTGALPTELANAHIAYTGTPGPGYTLISPIEPTNTQNTYAMAFDTAGVLRWYREFPGYQSLDVQMQRNGHYTVGLNLESGTGNREIGPFVELLPSGDSVATYMAPSGYNTDSHEVVLSGDSTTGTIAQFYAYDSARTLDLTSIGGPSSAAIYGHTLFRLSPNGSVAFSWDAWSYYGIADWTEDANNGFAGDFDHPNALSFDADSNYILSFRNMDAVVKMNRFTGGIIWQLGGARSTFTFVNDPLQFFSGQHFARRLANGHILMYDDGLRHSPPTSRAVEYALDTVANTATMVWQYLPSPAVFTLAVGSAERLQNGNTVVGFGLASQIDEVDPNAHLLSRGMFVWTGAKAFYRALRLPSLYQYETP